MCNSISPMVLHQREADRSISLRHPGCAGLVYAQKILAANHYCCWFELKIISLVKRLLWMNKPRNYCTTKTVQFLIRNSPRDIEKSFLRKEWLDEEGLQTDANRERSKPPYMTSQETFEAMPLSSCHVSRTPSPTEVAYKSPFQSTASSTVSLSLLPAGNL